MPDFKLTFEYQENTGAQFNEVYYRTADSISVVFDWPTPVINIRTQLLHPLNKLVRVRASSVTGNRVTNVLQQTTQGGSGAAGGPAVAGDAVVCALGTTAGGTRKIWLRGNAAGDFVRNDTTGADDPPANMLKVLQGWFKALQGGNFGIRQLTKVGQGQVVNVPVSSVDGKTVPGQAILTIPAGSNITAGGRCVISRMDKKTLPGLNGHFQVLAVTATTVTVPYQVAGNQIIASPGGFVKLESYQSVSVFNANLCGFDHFGTRGTKVPLFRSRGARRAVRIRSLA